MRNNRLPIKNGKIKNNIQKYRYKYNLTLEELSTKIQRRREHINKIEKGYYFPSKTLLLDLCSFFECDIGDLYYIEWDKKEEI